MFEMPNKCQDYKFSDKVIVDKSIFVLGYNPKSAEPFATWRYDREGDVFLHGRYFANEYDAIISLCARAKKYAEVMKERKQPDMER